MYKPRFDLLAVLLTGCLALHADEAPTQDIGALVTGLTSQLDSREGAKYWALAARLEGLGKEAVPSLRAKLKEASNKVRLACAKAILLLGDVEARGEAVDALEELSQSELPKDLRVAALEILGENGDPDAVLPILEKVFDGTTDPAIVIPLARVLWDVDRVARARDLLVTLLGSQDSEVKQQAALTLAEIDYFEGDVREVLRTLKREPTPMGRRAAALDRIQTLSRQLDRGLEKGDIVLEGTDLAKLLKLKEDRVRELEDKLERAGKSAAALGPRSPMDGVMDEIILQIQKSYVDEGNTDRGKLILNGIRGMVRALDDFSSFMDPEDTKSFKQSIAGEYFGIGAQVSKPQDGRPLEILRPIYGGPAYKAGIHSGDRVIEVGGTRTDELGIEEAIEKLKGPAGSKATLKILRRGWSEPKVFEIERRKVELASVHQEILPGKIGYVQLTQFGEKSAEEFTAALDELEKQGMAGLIVDLRNNPGGLLDSAVKIVDEFISEDKLPIVTQKGRKRSRDTSGEVATYAKPFARPSYPIIVLVNQRSASASEIVAGALKDFGRATILGKKTFGKGSVQRLIPLSSESRNTLGGEAQLRLTVQYYFLPLGRCVHTIREPDGTLAEEGGVPPDIEVAEDRLPVWRLEERERLRTEPVLLDYVEKYWNEIKGLFVEGDAKETSNYPGFAELHKALDTSATAEDVRSLVRYHVRRRLEDERGKEFACDVQEDPQLVRAILEILKKLGDRPEGYPRYASILPKAAAPLEPQAK